MFVLNQTCVCYYYLFIFYRLQRSETWSRKFWFVCIRLCVDGFMAVDSTWEVFLFFENFVVILLLAFDLV